MTKSRVTVLIALSLLLIIPAAALAETIAIDFRNLGNIPCGTTWQEAGIEFEIVKIPANHSCSGSCLPGADQTGLQLFPSALAMNLTGASGVLNIEMDIIESDPGLSATTWLYTNGGQTAVDETVSTATGAATFLLSAGGQAVDLLEIYCCDCTLVELRIIGDVIVHDTPDSWSAMKARY